ncbi:hypothetical protein PIB30_015538 [Stylosanthes scabra]|uniref:Uncharacterized protein n=1 Tax=Stylosanthes scabra TaxID=79078 RepID=A0ABU6Z3V1_9FABA|nr:hypothetical protein [Stylosanthes scabra]
MDLHLAKHPVAVVAVAASTNMANTVSAKDHKLPLSDCAKLDMSEGVHKVEATSREDDARDLATNDGVWLLLEMKKSPREAKKNKRSKENRQKAKKEPNSASTARPRPPFLNMEVSVGGAPARPKWCARATPFRNAQEKGPRAPARWGWRAHAATAELT